MSTTPPTPDAASDARPERVLTLENGAIEVLAAPLDVSQPIFESLWALLCETERARANRFLGERHKREYAVGRGWLRQLLGERLHASPRLVEIVEADHGKPGLGGAWASSSLRFNLSHSGGLAVYAFASRRELGVDVEELRAIPDAIDLAERFFSATESAAVAAYALDRRDLAFLSCWTRKEAFVKAVGQGLSFPLDAFSVSVDPEVPARILDVKGVPGPQTGWTLAAFRPRPTHVGAIVYQTRA